MRLGLRQVVAGLDERRYKLDILRIVLNEQVRQPRTDNFASRRVSILTGHRIIALGKIAVLVRKADLLRGRKINRDRLIELEPPDPLAAIFDKRAVALLAPLDGILRKPLFGCVDDKDEYPTDLAVQDIRRVAGPYQPRSAQSIRDLRFEDLRFTRERGVDMWL